MTRLPGVRVAETREGSVKQESKVSGSECLDMRSGLCARLFVMIALETSVGELENTSSEGTSGDAAGLVLGLADGPKRNVSKAQ